MRIDERHQGLESVVGDAEDADLAVGLGDVLYEPVDGVVGVGRFIDLRWIERADEWPIHDEVAFGAILAADVLHDADVAARDYDVERVVVAGEVGGEMRARGVSG